MAGITADNSYVTLSEANGYIAGFVGGDYWLELSDSDKAATLITATARFDQHYAPFVSEASNPGQPLAFPRKAFRFYEPVLGVFVDQVDGQIPERVKKAIVHLAFHYNLNSEELFGKDDKRNWTRISLEGMSLSDATVNSSSGNVREFPREVTSFVRPFLANPSSVYSNNWWRSN